MNLQAKFVKSAAQISSKLKHIRLVIRLLWPIIKYSFHQFELETKREAISKLNLYQDVLGCLNDFARRKIFSLSDWEKVDKDVQAAHRAGTSLVMANKAGRLLKVAFYLEELKRHNIKLELWSKRYK